MLSLTQEFDNAKRVSELFQTYLNEPAPSATTNRLI